MSKTVVKVALAVASAATLAGCGGSGALVRPDVTLSGAEFWAPGSVATPTFVIRESEGGSGAGVFLLVDGATELLAPLRGSNNGAGILSYQVNNQNQIVLTTVDGLSNAGTGYASMRYYRLAYTDGGIAYGADGIIGPATDLSLIATSSGTASYFGDETSTLTVLPQSASSYQLTRGDAAVVVNFDTDRVSVLLNDFTGAGGVTAVQINGLILSGNRFASGAGSTASVTGADFSSGTLDASGVLYGWNSGPLTPDEVGGVLQLTSGPGGVIVGRFAAD